MRFDNVPVGEADPTPVASERRQRQRQLQRECGRHRPCGARWRHPGVAAIGFTAFMFVYRRPVNPAGGGYDGLIICAVSAARRAAAARCFR